MKSGFDLFQNEAEAILIFQKTVNAILVTFGILDSASL